MDEQIGSEIEKGGFRKAMIVCQDLQDWLCGYEIGEGVLESRLTIGCYVMELKIGEVLVWSSERDRLEDLTIGYCQEVFYREIGKRYGVFFGDHSENVLSSSEYRL